MKERNLRSSGRHGPAMLLLVLLSLFSLAGIQKQHQEEATPPPDARPKIGTGVAVPVTMPALIPDKAESSRQNAQISRRVAVDLKAVLLVVLPVSSSVTSPFLLPSEVLLPLSLERPRIAVEVYQPLPASGDTKGETKPSN